MKIKDIETIVVNIPPRKDYRWNGLEKTLGSFVIIKVYTDTEYVGLGEAIPLKDWGGDYGMYYGETTKTVEHIIQDFLKPLLLNQSPFEIGKIHNMMDEKVKGHMYAKAAIDIALYDLMGKAFQVPVYTLLGGKVRDKVQIAHMLGLASTEEVIEEAKRVVADGGNAFQIKGGVDSELDIDTVRALRQTFGKEISLRLDANQGYRGHVKEVKKILSRLEEYGLDFAEQPMEGLPQMAALREVVNVRIIADESAWTPQDVLNIAKCRAADDISIYISKAGGMYKAKQVATIADAFNMCCDVNGSLEMGIGNAANLHFALSTPAVKIPSVIPVNAPAGIERIAGSYYADDLITEPFGYQDGCLLPLEKPGLGVELDEDKLNKYRL